MLWTAMQAESASWQRYVALRSFTSAVDSWSHLDNQPRLGERVERRAATGITKACRSWGRRLWAYLSAVEPDYCCRAQVRQVETALRRRLLDVADYVPKVSPDLLA